MLATNSDNDVEIMDCSPEPDEAPEPKQAPDPLVAMAPTQQHPCSKASSQRPTAAATHQANPEAPAHVVSRPEVTSGAGLPEKTTTIFGLASQQASRGAPEAAAKVHKTAFAGVKQEQGRSTASNQSGSASHQQAEQAGTSSANPLELSDSESEGNRKRGKLSHSSSTSSSIHADDRAANRHLHADTAASHGYPRGQLTQLFQQLARQLPAQMPYANAQAQQVPRKVLLDPRLRLRTQQLARQVPQQMPQQVPQHQQRQQQAAAAYRVQTAGLHTPSAPPMGHQSQAGSSAEQAQVVSDDDDDVVIVEAGMQPQSSPAPSTSTGSSVLYSTSVLHTCARSFIKLFYLDCRLQCS